MNEMNAVYTKQPDNISLLRVNSLKKLCKRYNLKVSGKKQDLIERLQKNNLKIRAVCKIQKLFRGYIVRKYIKMKGKLKNIINSEDFFTFEPINSIPFHQRYTYCENNRYVYGFDVNSILSLFHHKSGQVKNPYTRKLFPHSLYNDICQHIRISKILGYKIVTDTDNKVNISIMNEYEYISAICSLINEHGYISDTNWFTELSDIQLIRFIRELYDLWIYRLDIDCETRKKIIHPNGNPFLNIRIRNIATYTTEELKHKTYQVIYGLLNKGIDHEHKGLGCLYILTCLTLVSRDCASTLPWLFESVRY